MRRQPARDPVDDEVAPRRIVKMLELAPAAFRKVAARRHLMMRPALDRTVGAEQIAGRGESDVPTILGDPLATAGNADDGRGFVHRQFPIAAGR
jgi:hypothetical protein